MQDNAGDTVIQFPMFAKGKNKQTKKKNKI